MKWLVRWTVQDWNVEKIVELDFDISNNIENKKKFTNKAKYIKAELPKFEQYDLPNRKP